MELLLLLLAPIGWLAYTPVVHLPLLLVHALGSLRIAWRLTPRQPLTALFILTYVGMYFPNPIGVMFDWVALESDFSWSIFYQSNVLVLLGLDFFIVAARRARLTSYDANRLGLFRLDFARTQICIVLGLGVCAAAIASAMGFLLMLGVNAFTVEKTFRSVGGVQTLIYLTVGYIVFVLPLTVYVIGLKRFSVQIVYLFPVAALLLAHFLIYRTRTLLVASVLAWAIAQISRSFFVTIGPKPIRRPMPLVLRLAMAVGIPLIVLVGISLQYMRYAHTVRDYSFDEKRAGYLLEHTFAGGDLGYTMFLREAMARFPSSVPYLWGQSYYRLLFVPIPRSVWPGKPENTERIFARALDPALGDTGTTIPPGIVGDQYINFGHLGVLGMFMFGIFFGNERYRQFSDVIFLAGSGLWLIHLVRGAFTNPLLILLVTWLASRVLTTVLAPRSVQTGAVSGPGGSGQRAMRGGAASRTSHTAVFGHAQGKQLESTR